MRVRSTETGLGLGPGPGRGAWLCRRPECWDLAERRRAFGRALRATIVPDEIAARREELGL